MKNYHNLEKLKPIVILKQTTFLFIIYIFVCIHIIKRNLDKPTKLHKKKKII